MTRRPTMGGLRAMLNDLEIEAVAESSAGGISGTCSLLSSGGAIHGELEAARDDAFHRAAPDTGKSSADHPGTASDASAHENRRIGMSPPSPTSMANGSSHVWIENQSLLEELVWG